MVQMVVLGKHASRKRLALVGGAGAVAHEVLHGAALEEFEMRPVGAHGVALAARTHARGPELPCPLCLSRSPRRSPRGPSRTGWLGKRGSFDICPCPAVR
eukprot:3444061-Pyramimonas_sp.AAC.1